MKLAMFNALLSRLAGLGLAACLALAALPAQAVIGALDHVPASTLLMPYFEVDLTTTATGDQGVRTSLRINNTSATAMLTRITLWTDQGVPTYAFNAYMPGYDSTDVDMRLLFKGILPKTASAGQDPNDLISPQGSWSQDINFASCNGTLPYVGLLDAATVTGLRNAHTGQASTLTGGLCAGANHGDNIARGYVTVDTVNACTNEIPGDPGYFNNTITFQNVLVGTVTWTDPANNFSAADPAIHIEADFTNPIANTAGETTPTFYGRLIGWDASDNREPLGSVWQARFMNGGVFTGGTTAMVWRDPGAPVAPFSCASAPAALSHYEATFVDEEENVASMAANSFPLATQALDVAADLAAPYTFGFMHLNLNTSGNVPRQAVLAVRHSSDGRFSGSVPGIRLFRTGQVCDDTAPYTDPENPGNFGCSGGFAYRYYAPIITGPVGP